MRNRKDHAEDVPAPTGSRRAFLTVGGMAAAGAAGAAAGSGLGTPPRSTVAAAIPTSALEFDVRTYGAKGDGKTDDTVAIQSALTAAMRAPGSSVVLPAGDFLISTVGIDYSGSGWPVQPDSGPPYGYPCPEIRGMGPRKTRLVQKAGSTGPILTVKGKTGAAAGPANNNKATGARVSGLELVGTSTGGPGINVRSAVNCTFENIWIRNAGRSGVFLDREYFVSGVDDEYSYANSFARMKLVSNARWGVECSGTTSIGASLYDIEAIGNTLGGFKLAPTNMNLYGCQAIGNGTANASGRGLLAVRNSDTTSVNSALNLIGFRSEGNSAPGGYEVEIESGIGYVINVPSFYPTQGAHCLGIGLKSFGAAGSVTSLQVLGGFFGTQPTRFPTQRAIVLGSDARDTLVMNPMFSVSGMNLPPDALITDDGSRTSVLMNSNMRFDPRGALILSREITAANQPKPLAKEARIYLSLNAAKKQQLMVQFESGAAQVIASEP